MYSDMLVSKYGLPNPAFCPKIRIQLFEAALSKFFVESLKPKNNNIKNVTVILLKIYKPKGKIKRLISFYY